MRKRFWFSFFLILFVCFWKQEPAGARTNLFQLHDDGGIWGYDGESQCPDDVSQYCPGWTLIDRNPRTKLIVSADPGTYQMHVDGKIWRYEGGKCPDDVNQFCPGWTLIDRNPRTKDIKVGDAGLFQIHIDGKIWKHDGKSQCPDDVNQFCPGWTLIDRDQNSEAIVATGPGQSLRSPLYQRFSDGKIWMYDGKSQCPDDVNQFCPGWTLIDRDPATKDLITAEGTAFQRHRNGKIWMWVGLAGDSCPADPNLPCPGWELIDRNQATASIAGGSGGMYQLHANGEIWARTYPGNCPPDESVPCSGWVLIDRNPSTADISTGANVDVQRTLFQRHANGEIWGYDGGKKYEGGKCPDDASIPCPGWTLIDRNPHTTAIVARDGIVAL